MASPLTSRYMTSQRGSRDCIERQQGWRNDSRGGGSRPWGPSRKRSASISKGPKPPIQLLQLLKNSQKEVKRAHFVIYWVPPGPSQEMELMEPGGEGSSRPPPPPISPAMNVSVGCRVYIERHRWLLLVARVSGLRRGEERGGG